MGPTVYKGIVSDCGCMHKGGLLCWIRLHIYCRRYYYCTVISELAQIIVEFVPSLHVQDVDVITTAKQFFFQSSKRRKRREGLLSFRVLKGLMSKGNFCCNTVGQLCSWRCLRVNCDSNRKTIFLQPSERLLTLFRVFVWVVVFICKLLGEFPIGP